MGRRLLRSVTPPAQARKGARISPSVLLLVASVLLLLWNLSGSRPSSYDPVPAKDTIPLQEATRVRADPKLTEQLEARPEETQSLNVAAEVIESVEREPIETPTPRRLEPAATATVGNDVVRVKASPLTRAAGLKTSAAEFIQSELLHSASPLMPFPDPYNDAKGNRCEPPPGTPANGLAGRLMVPASADFPANCEGLEELCNVVRKVAIKCEVMAAVANSHAPGLQGFLDSIAKLNIKNFMVIAIDKPLADRLHAQGVPYYFKLNTAQGNHAVSAQKFGLIKEFVSIGCSVLLTDTDVVYLQNPFGYLYRDADIESMSDGWDNNTSHGYMDTVDDAALGIDNPARVRHSLRIAALNSGLWYVAATHASLRLMTIMQYRMDTEDVGPDWIQPGALPPPLLPAEHPLNSDVTPM
ncbi:hypothetical protein CYMTET_28152 [Cymbomonas tetramitiformis]|uniref:Nucleotide-diphospho-sugar transferase domain-containing protein n=1 Tax=Cymbomonas tetramitiformis TaxID=36881 RepID=A0AAE0FNT2_9CHLO|nr:hypothetical protein CYMTET_28152 [Cymbomonas tetramitiformis]